MRFSQLLATRSPAWERSNFTAMWTFLGTLAAIAGLSVFIWEAFGSAGFAGALLLLGGIAVALFREPSGPSRKQAETPPLSATLSKHADLLSPAPALWKQTDTPPLPLPPARTKQLHISPPLQAPVKELEKPLPLQELPTPLPKKASVRAAVEVRPIQLPSKQAGRAQRRTEPRFELIPHQMGGINARTVLPDATWRQLSKMVIRSNGGKCCECPNHQGARMECHEVWAFEWEARASRPNKVGVMRLTGLRPLCHLCHMAKHIKFAESQGELPEVMAHLIDLYDGLTEKGLTQLIGMAAASSKLKYRYAELDLTYLNDDRFAWIHEQMGRKFTANEMPDSVDHGPIRQRPGRTITLQPLGEPLQ